MPRPADNPSARRAIRRSDRRRLPEIPADIARTGRPLLDQQMWCFGRDIIDSPGNRLIARGFERFPCPHNPPTSTRYVWTGSGGVTVVLWAFGMLYASGGRSAFLRRHGFAPLLATTEEACFDSVWSPDSLHAWNAPINREEVLESWDFVAKLCEWTADYEVWMAESESLDRRESVIAAWKHPFCRADEVAHLWRDLAARIRAVI